MSGEASVIPSDAFIFRDLTLRGFWLARWFRHTAEQQRRALVNEIASLIITGKLHAPIHATYDITEIKEAVAAVRRAAADRARSSSSREADLTTASVSPERPQPAKKAAGERARECSPSSSTSMKPNHAVTWRVYLYINVDPARCLRSSTARSSSPTMAPRPISTLVTTNGLRRESFAGGQHTTGGVWDRGVAQGTARATTWVAPCRSSPHHQRDQGANPPRVAEATDTDVVISESVAPSAISRPSRSSRRSASFDARSAPRTRSTFTSRSFR